MRILRALLSFVVASMLLTPSAFAASGDLSLSNNSVNFSSDFVREGNTIRIWASVSNNSPNDLLGSVRFSTQNENIDSDQPISALAGMTDDVFVDWTPQSFGNYTITVTVIPWDPTDDNPNNNSISKTVYVEQDTDHDGTPNNQDEDMDGDGVNNDDDDYPLDKDESSDTDGDGTGDNADPDDDNDGILDEDDAFPSDPLHSSDLDDDQIPDEEDTDLDGDGLSNDDEEKAGSNPEVQDTDNDGVIDGNDPFPTNSDEWQDSDNDGIGDNTDDDIDGDGLLNEDDPSPSNRGPQASTDKNIYLTSVGEELVLDASSSEDLDGTIVEYIWEIGSEIYNGPQISQTFDTKGLQIATLTVLDDSGQSDSIDVNIQILDYKFLLWALLFALLLILLAFYLIYRYNRRALEEQQKKSKKTSTKRKKKK